MQYRKLGKTGMEVGEIGLGLEHLLSQEQDVVTETIRTAIDGGVNYIDCLSHNHDDFVKLGVALEGVRDKVYITYIAFHEKSVEETRSNFASFLELTKANYVDVFIIACCDKVSAYESVTADDSLLSYACELRQSGKVRNIGFSTHSTSVALKVIGSGSFDVLMYPVNPAFDAVVNEEEYIADDLGKLWDAAFDCNASQNKAEQIRKHVYRECERNGIGLIAMKPFGGGFLFRPDVNSGFTALSLIAYALSQSGVSAVIPGCSNPTQMAEILSYYTCAPAARDYSAAIKNSRWSIKGSCQYCSHCQPCAANIDIARVNRMVDDVKFSAQTVDIERYNSLEVKPTACIKCGECERHCPFEVSVMEKMEYAAQTFGS